MVSTDSSVPSTVAASVAAAAVAVAAEVEVIKPHQRRVRCSLLLHYVRSGLFKWGGDAHAYVDHDDQPYIEMVASPNNPNGELKAPVVNKAHDLAFYWPQYTAITKPADHEIMLFTGHTGWAIVKDSSVAKQMVKFLEISTIGVSKEAQLRTISILEMISTNNCSTNFFESGQFVMVGCWKKLREALEGTDVLQLQKKI